MASLPVVLMFFADTSDAPLPALQTERTKLYSALTEHNEKQYLLILHFAADPDLVLTELSRYRERVVIVHFSGHAKSKNEELQMDNGSIFNIGLSQKLGECPALRLVFLNACSTQSFVKQLVKEGIPAILATLTEVSDQKSAEVAGRFYNYLGRRYSLTNSYLQTSADFQSKYNDLSFQEIGSLRGLVLDAPNLAEESSISSKEWWLFKGRAYAKTDNWYLVPPLPKPGPILITDLVLFCISCLLMVWTPEMVAIPAGEWTHPDGTVYQSWERFSIDVFPVNNESYQAFLTATHYPPPKDWVYRSELAHYPVVNITLKDAQAYASYKEKRLPTLLEWEIACRGQQARLYPWGNDWETRIANTSENGMGSLQPNGHSIQNRSPYGVYDMVGNVMEWVITEEVDLRSTQSAVRSALIKGGAFNTAPFNCLDTVFFPVDHPVSNIGFRCAQSR